MPVMQSPPGPRTVIDGREYLYFGGTAYLGLQGHPEVIRAACQAVRDFGVGSATSRTGFGDTPPVLEVEFHATRFFQTEAAFYFASGYAGGHILVSAVATQCDAVFVDELAHYCIFEAAKLSGLPLFTFPHGQAAGLQAALAANLKRGQRPLVMSDGVFSALGDIAPVDRYGEMLRQYPGAAVLLDDAHGIGVLGQHGRGTYEHTGLMADVNRDLAATSEGDRPALLVCGTCSKALGGFGGIIAGSEVFVSRLKHLPYFAGASAPPVPVAAATAKALELVQREPSLRTQLRENVRSVKEGLRELGLLADETPVPIICLRHGSAENMKRIQSELMRRGILVPYMAAYSGLGPEGALRLAVFANHSAADIQRLLEELSRLV